MTAIPRERILARRMRFEAKQNKFKVFQERLREEEKRLESMVQEREEMKLKIIGRIMLERMQTDHELKAWFGKEIDGRLTKQQDRDLFSLN